MSLLAKKIMREFPAKDKQGYPLAYHLNSGLKVCAVCAMSCSKNSFIKQRVHFNFFHCQNCGKPFDSIY